MTSTKVLDSQKHTTADDTSIIQSNASLERLSKQENKGLSSLPNWLRANKLSLNVKKQNLLSLDQENLK